MKTTIATKVLHLMNAAESRLTDPKQKKEYVISRIQNMYPDLKIEEIHDTLEMLITVSKLGKILFNQAKTKCCLQ